LCLLSTRVSETILAGTGFLESFDFDFISTLYCIERANDQANRRAAPTLANNEPRAGPSG
jgi:hypothetical protein